MTQALFKGKYCAAGTGDSAGRLLLVVGGVGRDQVQRQDQNQDQRQRTRVSAPHDQKEKANLISQTGFHSMPATTYSPTLVWGGHSCPPL